MDVFEAVSCDVSRSSGHVHVTFKLREAPQALSQA